MQNSYNTIIITVFFLMFYFTTYFLVEIKKISLMIHKKIWNTLLAIFFLISGILGFILAFLIDNKFQIAWYKDLLWYHVEFGIAMTLIAFFHLLWHLKYYFPRKNKV